MEIQKLSAKLGALTNALNNCEKNNCGPGALQNPERKPIEDHPVKFNTGLNSTQRIG